MEEIIRTISKEVSGVLERVSEENAREIASGLHSANRIFIAGNGRSGLAGKMFAMRLMHVGYEVYVTGETITPSITAGDAFLVISGSGNTKSLVDLADKAAEAGATVYTVTTNATSKLGELAEKVLVLPAVTKAVDTREATIQPLGSQFDQSAHLLLDSLIVYLTRTFAEGKEETWKGKHANLE
ncbi:6-phospho-3-hexuloisomerase [Salimicrobium halophilum]|uniref:3-hexulose-6-phosphate isomerase n=1 Tax=Salimicrobium halophilum TaxID=86666 RepID=A0A1G8SA74_9BACI|nr:6-phospho-3-hexuloisomerase [Salimicrobium halophilum]SDJ26087.1 3-hexulose-6-phosphate isomerase [Salimicrobium halophilum]